MSLKDDYLAQMKTHLANWDKELDQLTAKMHGLTGEAKAAAQEQMQALRAQRDAAMTKMQEMSAASGTAMEEMKKGFEGAWVAMKDAMEKAAAAFKK